MCRYYVPSMVPLQILAAVHFHRVSRTRDVVKSLIMPTTQRRSSSTSQPRKRARKKVRKITRKKAATLGLCFAVLLILVAYISYRSDQVELSGPPASGHARMLAELEAVKVRSESSVFFGDAKLKRGQEMLAQLPNDKHSAMWMGMNQVVGEEYLKLGDPETALKYLKIAYEAMVLQDLPRDTQTWALFKLGITSMRLGEVENCINCQTSDSCIYPIQRDGIHQFRRGSEQAVAYFEELLKQQPDNIKVKWVLNIAQMTLGGYPQSVSQPHRIETTPASSATFPRFTNVSGDRGVNHLSLSGGVIADDFDGDGFLDIVASSWNSAAPLQYFRNRGDGSFENRSSDSGFDGLYGGLNILQADYDSDGDVDILVLRGAWHGKEGLSIPNSLLENDGTGRFRDVTFESQLGDAHFPTQTAAWADYDLDGHLDLYIGNEEYPSQLFRNNGDSTFTDVAKAAGVENQWMSKAVVWGDYDGDRYPDLYVSNYGSLAPPDGSSGTTSNAFAAQSGSPNRLYHNNGDGTFTDVASQVGVTEPSTGFSSWFWDFNNDGALDILASSYDGDLKDIVDDIQGRPDGAQRLRLYQGDGKGGFVETAAKYGLTRVSLTMGANFGDLDNDGFLDFYLGTGGPGLHVLVPNIMFRNRGGKGFSDVTNAGGFGHLQKGHGISFADIDNDGDQDVFAEMGGAFSGDKAANALFLNPGFGNHWITLRLVGTTSNRSAIGTRIRIVVSENGIERSIYRWIGSGGSFGANPLRAEIGLGKSDSITRVEVYWPASDITQTFREMGMDQRVRIVEGSNKIHVE